MRGVLAVWCGVGVAVWAVGVLAAGVIPFCTYLFRWVSTAGRLPIFRGVFVLAYFRSMDRSMDRSLIY